MQNKNHQNYELMKKYETDYSFHKKMDQKRTNFDQHKGSLINQQNLKIKQSLLQIFVLQQDCQVYFYYGFMQPVLNQMLPNVALYFIRNFNPKFHKKYKFVFFNNCVNQKKVYYDFKNIFLCLPIEYFVSLDQFIFVKPFFSQKISQWWINDELEKHFISKTRYVNNIEQLCPILNTNLQKIQKFLPRQILTLEYPKQAQRDNHKSLTDYRLNLTGQERNSQQKKNLQIFFLQMNTLFQKSVVQALQLTDYELNYAKIPLILQQLIFYFQQHQDLIKTQGLFRKSVSIDEENQTLSELMNQNFQYLKQIKNPHLIANLIKRFFAKLKKPIFSYQSFHKLMHDQGVTDKIAHLKIIINEFKQTNYVSLMFLIDFLVDKILPQQKFTKMDANNIAICFAPCLMRSQKASQLDLIYATKSYQVTKLIIDNFEHIFGNKQQRQQQIKLIIEASRLDWQIQLNKSMRDLSTIQVCRRSINKQH